MLSNIRKTFFIIYFFILAISFLFFYIILNLIVYNLAININILLSIKSLYYCPRLILIVQIIINFILLMINILSIVLILITYN